MNQISIAIKGEVLSSNFDEWKRALIRQVQSVNTELIADEDFVSAKKDVAALKSAEDAMKQAKTMALDQAIGVRQLFAAIDEIAAVTRNTRLSLERQIRDRNHEIRERAINSRIQIIQGIINTQDPDFRLIDHSPFLDRDRFEAVIKGKATIKGVENALDQLCTTIKREIGYMANRIRKSAMIIDNQLGTHKVLFQDRKHLLTLSEESLKATLMDRIAVFNNTESMPNQNEPHPTQISPETELTPDVTKDDSMHKSRITIDILSSKHAAIEVTRLISRQITEAIKWEFKNEVAITSVSLSSRHD